MSLFVNLGVSGDFSAITANKGEIIVHNGTKNVSFPSGSNGYLLAADAATATGLKWVAGPGALTHERLFLPAGTATTSAAPVILLRTRPRAGSYLVILNVRYTVSHEGATATFGLYKDATAFSTETADTLAGYSIPYTAATLQSFSGAQDFSFRAAVDTGAVIMSGADVMLLNLTPSNPGSSLSAYHSAGLITTATEPTILSDLTNTPIDGTAHISFDATYSLDAADSTATVGLYKNGTLIPYSSRTAGAPANTRTMLHGSVVAAFNGAEEMTLGAAVGAGDATLTVHDAHITIIAFASVGNPAASRAAVPFSTNATVPVPIFAGGFVPSPGNTLIVCSIVYTTPAADTVATFAATADGVEIPNTARQMVAVSGNRQSAWLATVAVLDGQQALNATLRVDSSGKSIELYSATMTVINFAGLTELFDDTLFVTNSVAPQALPGLSATPSAGIYMVLVSALVACQFNYSVITMGVYVNGALISDGSVAIEPRVGTVSYAFNQQVLALSGADVVSVRISTDSSAQNIYVYERTAQYVLL